MSADCLFCKIASHEIAATLVHETDRVVAFRDISPQAPVHVVLIPKEHHADLSALTAADPGLAGELLAAVAHVARSEDLAHGFRTVFNTGADGGQTVFHVHAHLLGGRGLAWPPG
jgi:histidine triad (HIT) family protein